MVRHVVMWNFKEDIPKENWETLAKEADTSMKALIGQIPGLTFAEMLLNAIETSTRDVMLVCELETVEDLKAYQDNPLHRGVAKERISPFVCDRACFDYEISC